MGRYDEEIKRTVEVLRRGGIILYPTDTVWGIGCDATNAEAVERIYRLKRRDDAKAMIVLVGDADMIWQYVDDVPDVAMELVEAVVKPLTIIYDRGIRLSPNLLAPDGSIAIRVTNEDFSRQLCRKFRKPIVSTSANISGCPAASSFRDISDEIKDGVDYIVDARRDEEIDVSPSSIIKISSDSSFKIIRK